MTENVIDIHRPSPVDDPNHGCYETVTELVYRPSTTLSDLRGL